MGWGHWKRVERGEGGGGGGVGQVMARSDSAQLICSKTNVTFEVSYHPAFAEPLCICQLGFIYLKCGWWVGKNCLHFMRLHSDFIGTLSCFAL